jgi:serine/threonine protein kinase
VIRYLDSFISDDDLVIVVEWAAAGDLKRQLRKAMEKQQGGFEERLIWKYFSQIAEAIRHMHDKRIMHRDLKPANIFLTLDGTIKVGDLGLSRELSEHTMQAHSKVGTPLYMSPEVLRGDGYDFKTDVWSLGCLLYELAMLKSPFKADGLNIYTLFQKISQGEFQPISADYSEELRSLSTAMMSTKSEDRPDIGYICDVARRMRAQTTEQAKLKRQLSSGGSGAGSLGATASFPAASEDKASAQPEARSRSNSPRGGRPAELTRQDSVTPRSGGGASRAGEGNQASAVGAVEGAARARGRVESDDMTVQQGHGGGGGGGGSDDERSALQYGVRNSSKPPAGSSRPSDAPPFADSGPRAAPKARSQPSDAGVYKRKKGDKSSSRAEAPEAQRAALGSAGQKSSRSAAANDQFFAGDDNEPLSMHEDISADHTAQAKTPTIDLQDAGAAFVAMSTLFDKLDILGFRKEDVGTDFTIVPFHFAVDITKLGVGKKKTQFSAGSGFTTLLVVISWLFKRIELGNTTTAGGDAPKRYRAPEFDAERDPPLAVAKHILLEAQVKHVHQKLCCCSTCV